MAAPCDVLTSRILCGGILISASESMEVPTRSAEPRCPAVVVVCPGLRFARLLLELTWPPDRSHRPVRSDCIRVFSPSSKRVEQVLRAKRSPGVR